MRTLSLLVPRQPTSRLLISTACVFGFSGRIRDHLYGAEERMRTFELKAETALGDVKQEIFTRLDFIAALTSKCLLVSVQGDNPCPRLIRVDEDVTHSSAPSRLSHYRRKAMEPFRRMIGTPKARPSKPTRYRVRFLCAHDMSAGDCGPDGQGYILESEKDWQRWLRKCLPLVQVRRRRTPNTTTHSGLVCRGLSRTRLHAHKPRKGEVSNRTMKHHACIYVCGALNLRNRYFGLCLARGRAGVSMAHSHRCVGRRARGHFAGRRRDRQAEGGSGRGGSGVSRVDRLYHLRGLQRGAFFVGRRTEGSVRPRL